MCEGGSEGRKEEGRKEGRKKSVVSETDDPRRHGGDPVRVTGGRARSVGLADGVRGGSRPGDVGCSASFLTPCCCW